MGDLFEDIAERVACARTRALMGERCEALALLQRARIDYLQFRDVLRGYPGGLALEHSIESAQAMLCAQREKGQRGATPTDVKAHRATGKGSRRAA